MAITVGGTSITFPNSTTQTSGDGPAFLAYMSAATASASTNTPTKIAFNTETFDTNSNFDSTTNYRFTPTVSGYYQVNLVASISNASSGANTVLWLYKNGTAYLGCVSNGTANYNQPTSVSSVVFFNGTTDYIEGYFCGTNTTTVYGQNTISGVVTKASSFSAVFIRS